MQQPRFWNNPSDQPGVIVRLLSPLSLIWHARHRRRMRDGPWHRLAVPVVCVGNINVGGTGKTPTVIALAERLKGWGWRPHVVSRGHGGALKGPLRVDERRHRARDVGDEPLLLAAFCDTWISRDRHKGAEAAIAAGADVILLDDGFQNPSLKKDASIVVADAERGFGNGRVLPAGPLREALAEGLGRADLLLVIGSDNARATFAKRWQVTLSETSVAMAELRPLETGIDWQGRKVLAFAGIGHPEKFFKTLRALGADVIRTEALDDHQPLSRALLQRLENDSFFNGAQMVTTEKDATRLPEDFKLRVLTLPVRLHAKDWSAIDHVLARAGVAPKVT